MSCRALTVGRLEARHAQDRRLSRTRRSGLTVWLYRWPLNGAAGAGARVANQVRQAVKADDHNDNDCDDRTDNGKAVVLTKSETCRRAGYLSAWVFLYGHKSLL